jgi:hypothetical protein
MVELAMLEGVTLAIDGRVPAVSAAARTPTVPSGSMATTSYLPAASPGGTRNSTVAASTKTTSRIRTAAPDAGWRKIRGSPTNVAAGAVSTTHIERAVSTDAGEIASSVRVGPAATVTGCARVRVQPEESVTRSP